MKENKHPLREMLVAAGWSDDYDNRNYAYKTVNAMLIDGLIQVHIVTKGKYRPSPQVGKYNVTVSAFGRCVRAYSQRSVSPDTILTVIGHLFQDVEVRNGLIDLAGSLPDRCDRCGGTGKLPHFAHVHYGICFQCGGVGVTMQKIIS